MCVLSAGAASGHTHDNTSLSPNRFSFGNLIDELSLRLFPSCCTFEGGSCWSSVCFLKSPLLLETVLIAFSSSRVSPTARYLAGKAGVDAQCPIFSGLCHVAVPSEADGSLCSQGEVRRALKRRIQLSRQCVIIHVTTTRKSELRLQFSNRQLLGCCQGFAYWSKSRAH